MAAFGAIARVAKSAVHKARGMGIKAGVIRPVTLWPFPAEAFHRLEAGGRLKGILTVEMNQGQMLEDVRLSLGRDVPTPFYGTSGGVIPSPDRILEELLKMEGSRYA